MKLLLACITMGLLAGCVTAPPPPAAEPESTDWKHVVLPGKATTVYRTEWHDGRWVVHARARGSASMFRKRVLRAPEQLTPLRFAWRVDRLMGDADLGVAERSDSPARVLVAFDGDHGQLPAKDRMLFELAHTLSGERPPYATLMYVWDPRWPVGTVLANARTSRIRKIVVESGPANLGRWMHYERDVAADFRLAFGEAPGPVVGLGLMTDADNTRSEAEAWYGRVDFR